MDTLSPFDCPYCDTELIPPGDVWVYTCPQCGNRLDLKTQYAYFRGLDAFKEGQDIFQKVSPKRRHRRSFIASDKEALDLFQQAYSSLQVAFSATLEQNQRNLAVEMMSSMTQEFMKRLMVSPLEAQYWNTIMVEQTAQAEYDRLLEKLRKSSPGFSGWIKRWRWNSRKNHLVRNLVKLSEKIKTLERQIDFVDIPHARNLNWKPEGIMGDKKYR